MHQASGLPGSLCIQWNDGRFLLDGVDPSLDFARLGTVLSPCHFNAGL